MTARESTVDAAFHECLRLRAYAKYAANPEPFAKPPPERSRAYKALCDWEGIADLCLSKVAKGATVKPPFGATRLSSVASLRMEFFKLVCGLPNLILHAKLASLFCVYGKR